MKKFSDRKIGFKMNMVYGLSFVLIVGLVGIMLNIYQQGVIIGKTDTYLLSEVDNISLAINVSRDSSFNVVKNDVIMRKYFETGYPFVVDTSGILKIHPKLEGSSISDKDFFALMKESNDSRGKLSYKWEGKDKTLYYNKLGQLYVCVSVYDSEYSSAIYVVMYFMLIALVAGCIVFVIVSYLFSRSITGRLNILVGMADKMSSGSFKPVDIEAGGDEIGGCFLE